MHPVAAAADFGRPLGGLVYPVASAAADFGRPLWGLVILLLMLLLTLVDRGLVILLLTLVDRFGGWLSCCSCFC